jgi:hypothetical protein
MNRRCHQLELDPETPAGAGGASREIDRWETILAASEKVDWRLDDVLDEAASFDFTLRFLPEALTGVDELDTLAPAERRLLGHIRAHGYLGMFGVIEEMILPFVVDHAKASTSADLGAVRALLRFAAEEAKHIELFRRFRRVFERGFGHRCELIGPAEDFARAVLGHPPLSVALAILHIEWMTQRHWIECVRDDASLEPAFKRLLRFHWMEEAQHARLDAMIATELARGLASDEIARGVTGYLGIVGLMDASLAAQAELDLASFERAAGRRVEPDDALRIRAAQHQSMRRTFLFDGMAHPRFTATLGDISADAPTLVARAMRELIP